MTPLPWSGSSFRRSAATAGSTRRATGTPSWASLVSVTGPMREDTFVELSRACRRGLQAQRALPFALPPAVPRGRTFTRLRRDEQRLPAHSPGARQTARGQVRVHVLPGRPVFLLLPRADRDGRLPDVLLRPIVDVGVQRHPQHPGSSALRAAYAQ